MNTLTPRAIPDDNISHVMKQLMKHAKLSANALATTLNFPTPTINRLITGEVRDPRASTMTAIADYFDITVDQLLGRVALPDKFNKSTNGDISTIKPPMTIPVLTITQAVAYQNHCSNPTEWFRWQAKNSLFEHAHVFAVKIKNDLYKPIFNKETLIIVNPDIEPESSDYVLVTFTGDTTVVLKKYVSEGRHKYLHPLSPDFKTISLDNEDCIIIGVIIEAYSSFK